MKHGLRRTLPLLTGTFGSPFHYKEEKLRSTAMRHPPVLHFKQEIIYSVHQEKQLSIDTKAWKCGEEKYGILKLFMSSRVSCNAYFRKQLKAVGLVQPFKVTAKMLAFSKQRHIACKENIVLLRFLVKMYQ